MFSEAVVIKTYIELSHLMLTAFYSTTSSFMCIAQSLLMAMNVLQWKPRLSYWSHNANESKGRLWGDWPMYCLLGAFLSVDEAFFFESDGWAYSIEGRCVVPFVYILIPFYKKYTKNVFLTNKLKIAAFRRSLDSDMQASSLLSSL